MVDLDALYGELVLRAAQGEAVPPGLLGAFDPVVPPDPVVPARRVTREEAWVQTWRDAVEQLQRGEMQLEDILEQGATSALEMPNAYRWYWAAHYTALREIIDYDDDNLISAVFVLREARYLGAADVYDTDADRELAPTASQMREAATRLRTCRPGYEPLSAYGTLLSRLLAAAEALERAADRLEHSPRMPDSTAP